MTSDFVVVGGPCQAVGISLGTSLKWYRGLGLAHGEQAWEQALNGTEDGTLLMGG